MRPCCLYKVRNNVDGKTYIGVSVNPDKRWKEHLYCATRRGLKTRFYNAIRLHGPGAFDLSILEWYPTEQLARQAEIETLRHE